MSEFKAGDKVITTAAGGWYREGEVFTLKEHYNGVDYDVVGWKTEEKGEGCFIHTENMEVLKQSPKDMLKNGDRLITRNGYVYILIGDILIRSVSWTTLECFNDYMESDISGEYDVMFVYRPCTYTSIIYKDFENNPEFRAELIWKRVEQTESEKQLKILQEQIQTLTEQAIKLVEQIKLEKL